MQRAIFCGESSLIRVEFEKVLKVLRISLIVPLLGGVLLTQACGFDIPKA
jgi:hypothetical protein